MLIYEDIEAVIASRAYELAQTGAFEDCAAIQREIGAEGFEEEAHCLDQHAVRHALDEICIARRQVLGSQEFNAR